MGIGHDAIDRLKKGGPIDRNDHFEIVAAVLSGGKREPWLELELRLENAAYAVIKECSKRTTWDELRQTADAAWREASFEGEPQWAIIRPKAPILYGLDAIHTAFLGRNWPGRMLAMEHDPRWVYLGESANDLPPLPKEPHTVVTVTSDESGNKRYVPRMLNQ